MARFIKGSSSTTGSAKGNSTGQAVIPKGASNERPAVAQIGALRFNSLLQIEWNIMMAQVGET